MSQFLAKEINGKKFIIDDKETHHIADVFRYKIGDKIKIFDGKGNKFFAVITNLSKDKTEGEIVEKILAKKQKNLILLFSPVSKSETEDLLNKCAQIGVNTFVPVITERTEHDITKKWQTKKQRWETVLLSACKQSERACLPKIEDPIKFKQAIEKYSENSLIAYEDEKEKFLSDAIKNFKENINLFIGPVGGFSQKEITAARQNKIQTVSIGVNVMRAETAAIVACGIILEKP